MSSININDIFILDVNFWKQLPKITFQQTIRDLSDDILRNGLIHPIIITNINTSNNIYKVIDGNKRLLACQQLNHTDIMCIIIKKNKKQKPKTKPNINKLNIITTYFKKQILCDVFSNKG